MSETLDINPSPSIKIIGFGGAGVNLVNKLNQSPDFKKLLIDTYCIDTSAANMKSDITKNNIIIGDGRGSGKIRGANLDNVRVALPELKTQLPTTDITLCISSLSGGSGSVIGPLFVNTFHDVSQFIYVIIADIQSEIDIDNTDKGIKSLENIAIKNDLYIPCDIHSNYQSSRACVDIAVVSEVIRIVELLSLPTLQIDSSDRLSFLNPKKLFPELKPGLKQLTVLTNKDYSEGTIANNKSIDDIVDGKTEDTTLYDSVLSIGIPGERLKELTNGERVLDYHIGNIGGLSRFRKDGLFTTENFSYIGLVSSVLYSYKQMIDDAMARKVKLNTLSSKIKNDSQINLSSINDSEDGIVL